MLIAILTFIHETQLFIIGPLCALGTFAALVVLRLSLCVVQDRIRRLSKLLHTSGDHYAGPFSPRKAQQRLDEPDNKCLPPPLPSTTSQDLRVLQLSQQANSALMPSKPARTARHTIAFGHAASYNIHDASSSAKIQSENTQTNGKSSGNNDAIPDLLSAMFDTSIEPRIRLALHRRALRRRRLALSMCSTSSASSYASSSSFSSTSSAQTNITTPTSAEIEPSIALPKAQELRTLHSAAAKLASTFADLESEYARHISPPSESVSTSRLPEGSSDDHVSETPETISRSRHLSLWRDHQTQLQREHVPDIARLAEEMARAALTSGTIISSTEGGEEAEDAVARMIPSPGQTGLRQEEAGCKRPISWVWVQMRDSIGSSEKGIREAEDEEEVEEDEEEDEGHAGAEVEEARQRAERGAEAIAACKESVEGVLKCLEPLLEDETSLEGADDRSQAREKVSKVESAVLCCLNTLAERLKELGHEERRGGSGRESESAYGRRRRRRTVEAKEKKKKRSIEDGIYLEI